MTGRQCIFRSRFKKQLINLKKKEKKRMSKRSFKSKQKTEATSFDWKIWSLPPTPTPDITPVQRAFFGHFLAERDYVGREEFFCDACDEFFSSADFLVRVNGEDVCFHCYHEFDLGFFFNPKICLLPTPPSTSTSTEPRDSESASK